jgi:hypothetical protein
MPEGTAWTQEKLCRMMKMRPGPAVARRRQAIHFAAVGD